MAPRIQISSFVLVQSSFKQATLWFLSAQVLLVSEAFEGKALNRPISEAGFADCIVPLLSVGRFFFGVAEICAHAVLSAVTQSYAS